MRAHWTMFGLGLGVASLAFAAFVSVLPGAQFVFDDHVLIERNADLRRPTVWRDAFRRDYYASSADLGVSGYYRPLAVLCNAADVRLWANPARGAHVTNLLLHALATLALVPALRALGARSSAAWCVAVLFAVHPVHAESVAFISGRVDVLAALFMFAALGFAGSRRRVAWIGVGGSALVAFLSKEIAVMLPLLLLVVWGAGGAWRGATRQIVALAVVVVAVMLLRLDVLETLLPTSAHNARPAGGVLLPLQTLGFALAALFAPFRSLSMEPEPGTIATVRVAVGAIVCAVAWFAARVFVPAARQFLWRAALAAVLSLLPVLNVFPQETQLSERFLYVASGFAFAPLGVLIASALQQGGWRRMATLAVGGLGLAALVSLSTWRAELWRDDVTVWRRAVAEEPGRAAFWDRLGLALTERSQFEAGEQALRHAVALDPRLFGAVHNLAVLLHARQRYPDAAEFYRRSIALQPRNVMAHINLGRALAATRDWPQAYAAYDAAVRLKPDHLLGHQLAAQAAMTLGNLDAARQHLEAAKRLAPHDASVADGLERLQRLARDVTR